MSKMNPEIKRLWVDDLRANPDLQGRKRLRTVAAEGNKFCCLGRLTELYRKETGKGEWVNKGDFSSGTYFSAKGDPPEAWVLPNAVADWAALDISPEIGDRSAVWLNDDGGYTFPEIADMIEEHL